VHRGGMNLCFEGRYFNSKIIQSFSEKYAWGGDAIRNQEGLKYRWVGSSVTGTDSRGTISFLSSRPSETLWMRGG